jgi:hypothetical protein
VVGSRTVSCPACGRGGLVPLELDAWDGPGVCSFCGAQFGPGRLLDGCLVLCERWSHSGGVPGTRCRVKIRDGDSAWRECRSRILVHEFVREKPPVGSDGAGVGVVSLSETLVGSGGRPGEVFRGQQSSVSGRPRLTSEERHVSLSRRRERDRDRKRRDRGRSS